VRVPSAGGGDTTGGAASDPARYAWFASYVGLA